MVRFVLIFFMLTSPVFSQPAVLDAYIQEGLTKNLALKQKECQWQMSCAALAEAKGLFMPSVSVEARYSRAGGGREIAFPVGDLMNPVYATLNQFLAYVGEPPAFPTDLPNEIIPFLRKEEHETKLRLIQPLFQPALVANYSIRKHVNRMEDEGRKAFARQLVSDIQAAYFSYLKTLKIQELLGQTRKLLKENLRVNESLFANDKVTMAAVHQARAELFALDRSDAEADKNVDMAAAYFNFLLNRPFQSSIEVINPAVLEVSQPIDSSSMDNALLRREELAQISEAAGVARGRANVARASFLPNIALVADWGYQGETYSFKPEDDYWMASLVMSWNLFNGGQDRQRVRQARLEEKQRKTQWEETRQKLRLQIKEASHNVTVAETSLRAARQRLISARSAFEIIEKKHRQGMASQVEFMHARNTMTQAEIERIVTAYDCLIRQAEFQRVTAQFPLEHYLK